MIWRKKKNKNISYDIDDPFADNSFNDFTSKIYDPPKLSINAKDIPIIEALRYLSDVHLLTFKATHFGVIIENRIRYNHIVSKSYVIPYKLMKVKKESGIEFWDELLKKYGITFPPGSVIKYSEASSEMVFVNTDLAQKKMKALVNLFR